MENNYTNYLEGWTHMRAQGETKGRGNDGRLCVVTGGAEEACGALKAKKYTRIINV